MAVVRANEIPQRQSAFGRGHTRRRKRIWRVLVDDDYDNETAISIYLDLHEGDAYSSWDGSIYDPICTCYNIECNQEESGSRIWLVTADYEIDTPTGGAPQKKQGQSAESNDPTEWLPKVTRSYGQMQIVQRRAYDASNNLVIAMVNSAGYPFANLPGRTIRFPVYTHECYETVGTSYTKPRYSLYGGAINSDAFNSFTERTVRLDSWNVDDVWLGGTLYEHHVRVFQICPDALTHDGAPTWQQYLMDQGRVDVLGNPILEQQTGQTVSYDWPLDDLGFPLSVADITAGTNFNYRLFRDHMELPFDIFTNIELR